MGFKFDNIIANGWCFISKFLQNCELFMVHSAYFQKINGELSLTILSWTSESRFWCSVELFLEFPFSQSYSANKNRFLYKIAGFTLFSVGLCSFKSWVSLVDLSNKPEMCLKWWIFMSKIKKFVDLKMVNFLWYTEAADTQIKKLRDETPPYDGILQI